MHLRLESNPPMAAIAEGLVLRVPAATQADLSAASESELLTILVADDEFTFDDYRTVALYGDLSQASSSKTRVWLKTQGNPV
jgi:hypothetical protein